MSHILIVEDELKLARLEADYLHNAGFDTQCLSNGLDVLPWFEANHTDLILLDLNIPKKDGRELLAEIKSDNGLKIIPIIVLSTSKNEKDIVTSYELKANCYICKPVELDSFINIILEIEKFWLKTVKLPDYKKIN